MTDYHLPENTDEICMFSDYCCCLVCVLQEEAFTFDAATGTITGYSGDAPVTLTEDGRLLMSEDVLELYFEHQ